MILIIKKNYKFQEILNKIKEKEEAISPDPFPTSPLATQSAFSKSHRKRPPKRTSSPLLSFPLSYTCPEIFFSDLNQNLRLLIQTGKDRERAIDG